MKLRRSRSIIIFFQDEKLILYNFRTKEFFHCSDRLLHVLENIPSWIDLEYLYSAFDITQEEIEEFIKLGAIAVEDTELAQHEADCELNWKWGIICAAFHFGMKDNLFISNVEAVKLQQIKATIEPSPNLFSTNDGYTTKISLPYPRLALEPLNLMSQRRTVRFFLNKKISKQVITDCLFSGMGITGVLEDSTICDLPLTMTPSGGARNPYEAYLYALDIEGIEKGFYHYSGFDNSLGKLNQQKLFKPEILLGNQTWTNDASAIIFLVANFERTMWKYPDTNAYRVVLIEAGHIAQNIILAAVKNGLTANPTSAINDFYAETALNINKSTHSVIHSLVIGTPDLHRINELAY